MFKKCCALFCALCLTFSLASCGGKSDKDALHARFSVLFRSEFPQEYLDTPDEYASIIEAFGVEDFAATFADPSKFQCYNVEIMVSNSNPFAVNLLTLHVDKKDVGKGGVYINTLGDDVTVGLPANFDGENAMYYQVIADASLSDAQVLQALGKMHVQICYVDASTGAETLEEANAAGVELLSSTILTDK